MLTVKEIRASVNELLTVSHSQRMKKDALVRYILRNAQDSCVEDLRKAAREKLVVGDGNRLIVLLGENRREMIMKTHVVLCVGLMMMRVRQGEMTCLGLDVFVFHFFLMERWIWIWILGFLWWKFGIGFRGNRDRLQLRVPQNPWQARG